MGASDLFAPVGTGETARTQVRSDRGLYQYGGTPMGASASRLPKTCARSTW